MINHVVVGYCVAIGRDEKSRALAGDLVMAVKFMLLAEPVLLEKPFHRRIGSTLPFPLSPWSSSSAAELCGLRYLLRIRDDGRFYFQRQICKTA